MAGYFEISFLGAREARLRQILRRVLLRTARKLARRLSAKLFVILLNLLTQIGRKVAVRIASRMAAPRFAVSRPESVSERAGPREPVSGDAGGEIPFVFARLGSLSLSKLASHLLETPANCPSLVIPQLVHRSLL